LAAAILIALRKQADQPTASNCSGLVPVPALPGTDNFTSRRPSSVRDAPPSLPPVVCALAVYNSLSLAIIDSYVGGFDRYLIAAITLKAERGLLDQGIGSPGYKF